MTGIPLTGKTGQVGWDLQRALAPLGNLAVLGRGEMTSLSDQTGWET